VFDELQSGGRELGQAGVLGKILTDEFDGVLAGAALPWAIPAGIGIHVYAANRSMTGRVFCNVDGEMLLVPQLGALRLVTERGALELSPLEIAVVPRGIRFRVELPDGPAQRKLLLGNVCLFHNPLLDLYLAGYMLRRFLRSA